MVKSVSSIGQISSNPFSPGFGRSPSSLVGRDDLRVELASGLATGPNDNRYTSVLMGVRGSGKTVMLNEIEDLAAADGWVVLSMDASTTGLPGRIIRTIGQARRNYEALDLGGPGNRRSKERSMGIRLGVLEGKWAATEHYDPVSETGLREQLADLADAARQAGTSVLVTVDEMHGIDRNEARRLSNDLQHITKRSGMPLAFVGAGLLEVKHTLMADKGLTFFHRCEQYEMPPLGIADVIKGLRHPIIDAGGSIEDDALSMAARSVGAFPYKLQVVGHNAWTLADAPDKPIRLYDIQKAIEIAEEIVDRNVSAPAWHDLADSAQRFMQALALLGGSAGLRDIAQEAGISGKQASAIQHRLSLSGYTTGRAGIVQLTELVPARVVIAESRVELATEVEPRRIENAPDATDPSKTAASSRSTSLQQIDRCRRWMPRVKAYCVLAAGHAGRCRST